MTELTNIPQSEIVIYTNPDNSIQLDVKLDKETVWLNVEQMTQLFGCERTVITRHINNVFKEGEVDKSLGCAKFAHPKDYGRRDGFVQNVMLDYYNLDVIISVGYRVHSIQGEAFRQWASKILKDYLIKGFAINKNIQLQHYQAERCCIYKDVVSIMSRTLALQESPTQYGYSGLFNGMTRYTFVTRFVHTLTKSVDFYSFCQWGKKQTRKFALEIQQRPRILMINPNNRI